MIRMIENNEQNTQILQKIEKLYRSEHYGCHCISAQLRFAIMLWVSIAKLSTLSDLFRVLFDPWDVHWFCLFDIFSDFNFDIVLDWDDKNFDIFSYFCSMVGRVGFILSCGKVCVWLEQLECVWSWFCDMGFSRENPFWELVGGNSVGIVGGIGYLSNFSSIVFASVGDLVFSVDIFGWWYGCLLPALLV